MIKLLYYLKKYRVAAIAALVMMLIELAVELAQPYLISKIIDNGIQQGDLSVVWLWGGVLVGSAVVAFAAGIASSFFASHASLGFGYDLREKLYEKVQTFSYAVFNRFATSSLITRLTGDVTQVQDTVFMSLRFMTRVPLVVIGSMIMAVIVNPRLGLLLVVMVPVLLIVVVWMIKKAALLFRNVQRRLDAVNGVIQENLTGIRLIRVFVRMGHEIERFAGFSGKLMKGTISALRLTETTMPFMLLMMNVCIIAVLWFGRVDIASGNATVGEVVAVINYLLRTIGAMSALSWILVTFSRASASAQRLNEVFNTEDTSETEQNKAVSASVPSAGSVNSSHFPQSVYPAKKQRAVQGAVEFRSVGFSYPNSEITVLDNITFTAKAGERIAIMGATGSGKSSLVQLIPRLYTEDQGKVRIDGADASELDLSMLRGAIGYVPQEVVLFTGSIRENIAWGQEEATLEEIVEAAKRAQIHETIENLPNGYDTLLGQRGVNLSGGQKQRLSIARALVRRPRILILDDSTSALDVATEGRLLDALEELSCTTFIITQKISSTTSADLILLLDDGQLIGQGKHEDLMESSELYRRIHESQYGEGAQHVQSIH
ncbi:MULTISPECIES: ABC transporter ATP-binding protein [Paenibacillus]|uniref:ABC transporter ATP-binding protein n=1 Tax=Paenibacillus TaxID=44249 RepID=UPI000CFCE3E4|nr:MULTISPECIES: ABC transporter ATP-binding protein [Paenibacillus]MCL6660579.1 ABC transporter ATP-binding protein/permease [Paenibacillus amylolyticus]PRA02763.1 ABC transporter ATP-binding protein [Paenibacillus sp. MYb63]PRA45569.1 ABC transporter ATP-binding protein [Paenibacillus sp. MYb67]WJM09328.1 ABC transporter ATP-binding protein [Paenibacillus sp. PK1-4R]